MSPSKIEWTDETWNPITGCTPISEGCEHCYAKRMSQRHRGRFGYPKGNPFRVTLHADKLDRPTRWRKPRRVFVCSMGDLFHTAVQNDWLVRIYAIFAAYPQHTFMILTKRPERMKRWHEQLQSGMGKVYGDDGLAQEVKSLAIRMYKKITLRWPLPNLWLGVTVENQKRYDERWKIAQQIPAAVTFVSMEPMLGPIDIDPEDHPDWIILGGETGPGAREMRPAWAYGVRDQCEAAGVPFFFKKWGTYIDKLTKLTPRCLAMPREYPIKR